MIDIELHDDELVVTLAGDIDARTAYLPYEETVANFDQHRIRAVVIDLAGVTFADSTALGMLIRIREHASEHGATCTLRNIPPVIGNLLRITGLDQALEIA